MNNALFTIEQVDNKLIITVEAVKPETVETEQVDLSKYKPFPEGYVLQKDVKIKSVKISEFGDVKTGAIGTLVGDDTTIPKFICDNESDYMNGESCYIYQDVDSFAPLNPSDHPDYKAEQPEARPMNADEIADWATNKFNLSTYDEINLRNYILNLLDYELNKAKR